MAQRQAVQHGGRARSETWLHLSTALLGRLHRPLLTAPRGRRVAAAAVLGVLVVAVAVALPVLVGVGSSLGWAGALAILMLEALGLGLAVTLLFARRSALAVDRVRRASQQDRAAVRKLSRTVDRLDNRVSRQGRRGEAVQRELRELRALADDDSVLHEVRALEARIDAGLQNVMRQNQAVANLFALVPPRGAVPPLGGWAASPDLALVLVDEVLRTRPATVVECGSGLSTLFMALAVVQHDLPTRVVALEHHEKYRDETLDLLRRNGVDGVAEVRHAPLQPTSLPDHRPPWYDESALDDLHDVGLLVVDGPPGSVGGRARLPAVPLLLDRLAPVCTVILDDHQRPDEQAVADEWAGMLPDFDRSELPLEKGAAVFRRGQAPDRT